MRSERRSVVGLTALLAACATHTNPVLQVPAPPTTLYLAGRMVGDSGASIPGGRIELRRLAGAGVTDTAARIRNAADGGFRFDSVSPGRYELRSLSIGYRARRDTFALSAPPGLTVLVTMLQSYMCLDICPADPSVVRAALAQQAHWVCDRDRDSIDETKLRWSAFLAAELRAYLGHQLDSAQIARQIHRIGNDAECRRIAVAMFKEPTSLAYTLYKWRSYWLLSDPYFGEAVLVDEQLHAVAGSSGGGFVYWVSPRPKP